MRNSSILSSNNSKRTTLRSVPWRLCLKGRPNMDEFTTMTVIEKADLDAKIERMLSERDGLRRELCQVIASYHGENDVDIAKERGWDCFENCTQVGGEWLVNEGKA